MQNEPMATQTWESCIYTAEDERDFIKNVLGPTMKREGLSDRKIIAWTTTAISSTSASAPSSPTEMPPVTCGVLASTGTSRGAGGTMMFDNVRLVRETFPDEQLLFTEATVDPFKADDIYSWRLGEYYGRSMINDFNDGAVGSTDWNVLPDEQGGRNHVGNYCFAPVHANTKPVS
jgi:glucosylceramidase